MINRIIPFFYEIFIGILLAIIAFYTIPVNDLLVWIKEYSSLILALYSIIIAVSAAFTVLIFNENDNNFIRFLINKNADKWYRLASIFNLGSFFLGLIALLILPTFEMNSLSTWIVLFFIGINLYQIYTTLKLIYNYIDIKRFFQEKSNNN